jgi:hypothetical protein
MPEQITKYPDITLEVLKGGGAVCGKGAPQKILTKCPAARFCSLPTGEICVYGINEIPQMTQIKPQELTGVVCPVCPKVQQGAIGGMEAIALGAVLVVGLLLGRCWQNFKASRFQS